MKKFLLAIIGFVSFHATASSPVSRYDSRMTVGGVSSCLGLKWIDGRQLPIEGRAFGDTERYFDRLPFGISVNTNVNEGVRALQRCTAGMQFRFITTSPVLSFLWVPTLRTLDADNMVAVGQSGIDVYTQKADGKWHYLKTGRIWNAADGSCPTGRLDGVRVAPGTPILVNLPLYNGISHFSLGIDPGATVSVMPRRKNGMTKPVVFYGTSITQGASASRPGLSFVNIVGRELDVPVVNLGFSGSGVMELEMSEYLAKIDASCYVLDCLWNMGMEDPDGRGRRNRSVPGNFERFVRNLRAKRPNVPIVMAEQCDIYGEPPRDKDVYVRNVYEKLIGEGWKNLVYLPKKDMYSDDGEGSIDGCHPNDWGMMHLARAFGKAVRQALGLVGR